MLLHVLADQALSLQRDAFYHPSHLPKPGLLLEPSLVSVAVTKHQSKSTWKGLFGYFWFPVHHHGNSSRREVGTGRDAAYWLGQLHFSSFTAQTHQFRDGRDHSGLDPPSFSNEENAPTEVSTDQPDRSKSLSFPFSRCL